MRAMALGLVSAAMTGSLPPHWGTGLDVYAENAVEPSHPGHRRSGRFVRGCALLGASGQEAGSFALNDIELVD